MLKLLTSSISFFLFFLLPHSGLAAQLGIGPAHFAKLLNIGVKGSEQGLAVDLKFDKPVSKKQVQFDVDRNFVQLVLNKIKMDGARIIPIGSHVRSSEVQKVFAYPYSPDLSRVRLILKEKKAASGMKSRIWLSNIDSKTIRIFLKNPPDRVADRSAETQSHIQSAVNKEANFLKPNEEKELLQEVLSQTNPMDPGHSNHGPSSGPEKQSDDPQASKSIGIKASPSKSFFRMIIALFGILALFLCGVLGLRKYASKLKSLPFGKKERLIQVIATHYLGNKKSISLVKVTGEYMVVGVSNEGISLISKLGSEVNVDKYLEDRFWGGTFEKYLNSFAKDIESTKFDGVRDVSGSQPRLEAVADAPTPLPGPNVVRASIKEKITKLKPLV